MNFSNHEKRALKKLLAGAIMITSNESYTTLITGVGADMEISSKCFYRWLRNDLIYQDVDDFYYYLKKESPLLEEIKK